MTLLVLGNLSIDVMGLRANDDRDYLKASLLRRTKTLRAKEDTVATIATSAAHDDGLKNAAQSDVLSELDELLIGELSPRVAWILVNALGRHLKRLALDIELIQGGQNCCGGSPAIDARVSSVPGRAPDRLSSRLVDKIELLNLRCVPRQAHERIVPLRSSW